MNRRRFLTAAAGTVAGLVAAAMGGFKAARAAPGTLNLRKGLNYVSWTGEQPVLLRHLIEDHPRIDHVYRFDNDTGVFEGFIAGAPAIANTLEVMIPGLPYWLDATGAVTIEPASIAETPSSTTTVHLIGRELDAFVAPFSQSVEQLLANDESVRTLFRWDPAAQNWQSWVRGAPPFANTLNEIIAGDALYARVAAPTSFAVTSDGGHALPGSLGAPLRIASVSPNEDSPLEDKVVLRGDDELLAASAQIEGGTGEVRAWWFIDDARTPNGAGLAPTPMSVTPGGHDDGRLYVTDATGRVERKELTRVVKLPPFVQTRPLFGVVAHVMGQNDGSMFGQFYPTAYATVEERVSAVEQIADAGFDLLSTDFQWASLEGAGKGIFDERLLADYDRLVEAATSSGIELMPIVQGVPRWASAKSDVGDDRDCILDAIHPTRYHGQCQAIQIRKVPLLAAGRLVWGRPVQASRGDSAPLLVSSS